ncbi:hypothetical protein WDU94_012694 [Cyamophila willieti]
MTLIKFVFLLAASVFVSSTLVEGGYYYKTELLNTCKVDLPISVPTDWITMVHSCSNLMMQQVQKELNASLTYLAMGAHFSRDCVNRPGFAKYFFDSASEERQHAIKFISYLTMRGNLTDYHKHVLALIPPHIMAGVPQMTWNSSAHAIQDALKLETLVTESIRQIIIDCEQGKNQATDTETVNDYHLSDWLTGEFLDEQYKGQRKLAGMLSTLRKMENSHGKLGEFLMDKTLL